jgi:hypothetical protein
VPVGTAAASHLFEGFARPRALGVIGALTFLGMAAGPFVGAAILGGLNVEARASRSGLRPQRAHALFAPSWRWVFYINVPIGICALLVAWGGVGRLGDAASERRHRRCRRDHLDGSPWVARLVAITLLGSPDVGGLDPRLVERPRWRPSPSWRRIFTIVRGFRRPDPFIDPRLFKSLTFASRPSSRCSPATRSRPRSSAGRCSSTASSTAAPSSSRSRSGSLAAATAVGALVSGFAGPLPVAAARDARRAARLGRRAALDVALDAGRSRSARWRSYWRSSGPASG